MPPKRKRRPSPPPKGLAAGEHLKRAKLAGNNSSAWGWVDIEVSDPSQITPEHRLMTCGLSRRNRNPFCGNKYVSKPEQSQPTVTLEPTVETANGESENDIIVVSDDEPPNCTKKACKNNPNCLNYLGQDKWEDEGMCKAREQFLKASDLGFNPMLNARDPDLPGWAQEMASISVNRLQDTEKKFEDSPIFQLQVTFAALQEKQQDAQEFSKLFMSHLDIEFRKQSAPSLKTLISTQVSLFTGPYVATCESRSERSNSFLELEINIENNSRLEDRIAALLQDEKLTGDNRFTLLILHSDKSTDELRALPPVLHFSLLRFVYDFASMERKKSKHNLLFPTTLDMGKFLGRRVNTSEDASGERSSHCVRIERSFTAQRCQRLSRTLLKLRFLIPGSTTWFQFDDDTVTKIDLSGEKRHSSKEIIDILNWSSKRYTPFPLDRNPFIISLISHQQPRIRPAKKRRIEDSEDEIVEPASSHEQDTNSDSGDIFSSKDAYMLVYARKEFWPGNPPTSTEPCNSSISHRGVDEISKTNGSPQPTTKIPSPPPRARDLVRALNTTHYEACEQYLSKEKELNERFFELREWMRSVYLHWGVESADEDSVIVSRQALEGWLSKPLTRVKNEKSGPQPPGEEAAEVAILSDILCEHAGLDPRKCHNMKRVSKKAHLQLISRDGFDNSSELFTGNPARHRILYILLIKCVERLYQIQHPRIVAEFDNVCDVKPGETGFWLSKAWLKDWRLQKPRMHVPLYGDAAPDSAEFRGHVRCEHDQLSLVSTARRSISKEACDILLGIFPHWRPLSTTEAFCSTCETIINSSKEDKRELRKKAEDEKARLRHMYDNALIGNTLLLENVPCAVVSAHFVRLWRKWLGRPTDIPRPDVVETSTLFCEHGNLVFDPNAPNDWDCNIALIQLSEWVVLEGLYRCGPVVSVEKRIIEDPNGFLDTKFVHPIPVCHDCRMSRRSNYELTDITVRLQSGHVHTEQNSASRSGESCKLESTSLGLRSSMGLRQSKRIRQGRARRENARLTVSKSTTVKDMKIMIQDVLKIPMICQRLFYKNEELEDNTATVESLGILMNDTLDLREEGEEGESDGGPRKRRAEEKGFGGTLLATSSFTGLSWDAGTSSEGEPLHEATRACPTCTYDNPPENDMCDVCQGQLIGT
ncbi:hypothetical protein EDD16DRAFT_1891250 [Pisolithus croceorrhizus]|nr:hypothetical protein EDD16DRAFT_1891250 [Pisolithus croceorrhizus]